MSATTTTATNHTALTHRSWFKTLQPFLVGGISGIIATSCTQPIDMIKVRLQLSGEGARTGPRPTPISVVRDIMAHGKLLDLYQGLSAGILRQLTYGMTRLGFFFSFESTLKDRAKQRGKTVTFLERALAGLTAGGLSAGLCNPAEVALIRMQSDGLRPVSQRANYRSAFDALARISRNEGVPALWNGAQPTIIRAMATNFGQLAFFSESKHQLQRRTKLSAQAQTVLASGIAGFFAAFFSLPVDFMKTRLQRQTKGVDGAVPYRDMLDCFVKVAKNEGLLRFYRGFGTYFLRIAPHSVISLIIADNLIRLLSRKETIS